MTRLRTRPGVTVSGVRSRRVVLMKMGLAARRMVMSSNTTSSMMPPSLVCTPMPALPARSTWMFRKRTRRKSPAVSDPNCSPLQPLSTTLSRTSTSSLTRRLPVE